MRIATKLGAAVSITAVLVMFLTPIFCNRFDTAPASADISPKVFMGKRHNRMLVVSGTMDQAMLDQLNAKQADGSAQIDDIQIYSLGGFVAAITPLAESLKGFAKPIRVDYLCGSACVGLVLHLGAAVEIADDAYLWFHLGGNEPFGHDPVCGYCMALAPYYRRVVRVFSPSEPRAMRHWADQFSPGLGHFLVSCGLFDDPDKGIAMTWRQIKAFGTPGGPESCTDIAGQDLKTILPLVEERLRAQQ